MLHARDTNLDYLAWHGPLGTAKGRSLSTANTSNENKMHIYSEKKIHSWFLNNFSPPPNHPL